jgi:NitT/TauT family transport system ATP-binding protein
VAEVNVAKPHPRKRDDSDLLDLRRSLLEQLGVSHDV